MPKGRGVKVSSCGLPWPPVPLPWLPVAARSSEMQTCRSAEVSKCRDAGVPRCRPIASHVASRGLPLSFLASMKCRGAEVQNVEALQCHPNYAFMGGGASDGLKSRVSQKVLIEKQRITYHKHLALSLPSARSRRPSLLDQGNINIYTQIHCFSLVVSKRGPLPIQNIWFCIGFTTNTKCVIISVSFYVFLIS